MKVLLLKLERQAIKKIEQNTNINVKKANKWTTTVIKNTEDKIREGQVLLDQRENYETLTLAMATETSRRSRNSLKPSTEKWLPLTPNPPRSPVLYTLVKIHKPNPVGRPIRSGCDGVTERISSFGDYLLQPIRLKFRNHSYKRYNRFLKLYRENEGHKRTHC